jgi:Zn-dependent protease with chaperone function
MVLLVMVALLIFSWSTPVHSKIDISDIIGLGILILNDDMAEKILGEIGSSGFEKEFGVSENTQENARVSNIGNKLVQYVSRPKVKYQFKVTNNSEVNACAIPGGYVYVNQGLLNCPGLSESELAFVLSHEITHVDKRHGLKQMKSALPLSVLKGQISSESAQKIADIVLNIYMAGRSRKDEQEADLEGFKLLVKAGYDPSAGLSFMRRLETLSKKNPDPFERLFMTHPPTHDRAEALKDAYIVAVTGSDYKESTVNKDEELPIADGFDFPLGDPNDAKPFSVSQHFQAVPPEALHQGHLGVDFGCRIGTTIRAVAHGSLAFYTRDKGDDWGNCIILKHKLPSGDIVYSQYAHLSKFSDKIEKIIQGEKVPIEKGEEIGLSGQKGSGPHLHLEIKKFPENSKPSLGNGYSGKSQPGESVVYKGVTFYDPLKFITNNRILTFKILQTQPQNYSGNVAPESEINIQFNQPVDLSTVEKGIKLTASSELTDTLKSGGLPLPILAPRWEVDGNNLICRNWHNSIYVFYQLKITPELKSVIGTSLDKEYTIEFSTLPPRDKILLEKEPQHLGDDVQNVRMVYLKEFKLSKEDLANRKEAVVKLRVKGIPKKDPIISFNRREVGRAVTKADVWEWFEFSFKPDILHEGKNLLDIETFIPDFYETFDDCEFADVYLLLK